MPLQSSPGESKTTISSAWTVEEREALASRIETDIQALVQQEQEWRKTIHCEDPCFEQNAARRSQLGQMTHFILNANKAFLENNRQNFADYIV